MVVTGAAAARLEVLVTAPDGLHARPAALFVQAVTRSKTPVFIAKDGGTPVDARSILGVLSLDVRRGDVAVLTAEGDGAEATLGTLAGLLRPPAAAEHG